MNIEEFRSHCLSRPGATEHLPFDDVTLVFKVADKIFALTTLDQVPFSVNLKCDPERAVLLREQYPAVQPGYHMNKKHWNTIVVGGAVGSQQLRTWVDDSYQLVINGLSRRQRENLGEPAMTSQL